MKIYCFLIAFIFIICCQSISQILNPSIGDSEVPRSLLLEDLIIEENPAEKIKLRKQWFIDLSLSHFVTRYGRADFDLNGYLDYRMRDISYNNGAFKGLQTMIAIKKEVFNKLDIGLSFGHFKTTQFVSLNNHLGLIDRQEGFNSFLVWGTLFDNEHLMVGIPLQYRPTKGLFFELMPNLSFNVSHWKDKEDFNVMNPLFVERYSTVLDNSIYVSKNILFGRAALGYEYKGLFIKAFYERNLSNITSTFPFRGEEFTIEYPKWVNWGLNLGLSFRLSDKPFFWYHR